MFYKVHNDIYAIDNSDHLDDLILSILRENDLNTSLLGEVISELGEDYHNAKSIISNGDVVLMSIWVEVMSNDAGIFMDGFYLAIASDCVIKDALEQLRKSISYLEASIK
jgi:hypothetical protein